MSEVARQAHQVAIRPDGRGLVTARPLPDAKLRLFCFPYAGAGASVYRSWSTTLPSSIELCAVQYPGREGRSAEPSASSLVALAESVASSLRANIDRPWAMFGHSMGALVAFEVARLLYDRYRIKPEHAFFSGAAAPHVRRPLPIAELSNVDFLRAVVRLNGMPREVLTSRELLAYALPILRADFRACERYQYVPGPPLPCPLTILGGQTDVRADQQQLEAWSAHTSVFFSLKMFPGDHFFVRSAERRVLDSLLAELSPLLSMRRA